MYGQHTRLENEILNKILSYHFFVESYTFSAFSARPDRAFPTVFSTQYPRNGNGWAWGRGWAQSVYANQGSLYHVPNESNRAGESGKVT